MELDGCVACNHGELGFTQPPALPKWGPGSDQPNISVALHLDVPAPASARLRLVQPSFGCLRKTRYTVRFVACCSRHVLQGCHPGEKFPTTQCVRPRLALGSSGGPYLIGPTLYLYRVVCV